MKKVSVLFLLIISHLLYSQETEIKNYTAIRVTDLKITIDGLLDEPEWQSSNWENEFTQYEPFEGRPPSQQTEFSILYDENNLYIAIKALDKSPDSIVQRLTRRDEMDGDMVGIAFDTYHDHRTGFGFLVSAAGVKNDIVWSNDGMDEDFTWDPIWWVKTTKTEEGWNAEMRIPLTQLRFEEKKEQNWGLQVIRFVFRKEELSLWQPTARKKLAFISQAGDLRGISGIRPQNSMNVMPYVVARTERFEKEPENPFRESGKVNGFDTGLDAKIGLTNYLTLDLTVNPDFGQVEADPSEVNLSTFETFFPEKRPFFIEGKNILEYKLMFGDGDLASDGLFYSRRIGHRPSYEPEIGDNEYSDVPEFTRILGAAKITGKTNKGWSLGFLESVTAKENAKIYRNGIRRSETVEPLANYFVGRLQKDFNDGNTYLGGMITAVNRNIDDDNLDFLHKAAYSGGIDFVHKWDDKNWEFNASSYFSRVEGSTEAITQTQESWLRTFQRPDAPHIKLDTTRTSLMGQGGKIVIGKMGGNLKFMGALAWKSPGLELNDIGFMRQADNILEVFWLGYRIFEPFSIFRDFNFNFNQYIEWDFSGRMTGPGGNINMHTKLKNYWNLHLGCNINGRQYLNSELRGGPSLKTPGNYNFWVMGQSNDKRKFTIQWQSMLYYGFGNNYKKLEDIGIELGYRPVKSLKLSVKPNFTHQWSELQYVDQTEFSNLNRYIFSTINRKTVSASLRVNYNLTPDLTIQYWGQPFIASGSYHAFKYITDSKAENYNDRFRLYQPSEITYHEASETYRVLESGLPEYGFDKPDFNVKVFLSNMVIRWEYQPGSTLYLVWSQTRSGSVSDGSFDFSRDINRLFKEKADNIFLVKMSYRIGR